MRALMRGLEIARVVVENVIIGTAEGWIGIDANSSHSKVAVSLEGGFLVFVAAVVKVEQLLERERSEAGALIISQNGGAIDWGIIAAADGIVKIVFVVIRDN